MDSAVKRADALDQEHNEEKQPINNGKSINWSKEELSRYDATLICTNHDNINYEELVENSKLVVDTRNATRLIKDNSKKIVKA